jgi:hypothetical protein
MCMPQLYLYALDDKYGVQDSEGLARGKLAKAVSRNSVDIDDSIQLAHVGGNEHEENSGRRW